VFDLSPELLGGCCWWPVTTDDGTSKDSILKINTMKAINQAHYFTNLLSVDLGIMGKDSQMHIQMSLLGIGSSKSRSEAGTEDIPSDWLRPAASDSSSPSDCGSLRPAASESSLNYLDQQLDPLILDCHHLMPNLIHSVHQLCVDPL